VTNSSDRTLRQFVLPAYPPPNADREYVEHELEPTHRFNDPIGRTAWHAMSYSPDGEWLAGGEQPILVCLVVLTGVALQGRRTRRRTRYIYGTSRMTGSLRARWMEGASLSCTCTCVHSFVGLMVLMEMVGAVASAKASDRVDDESGQYLDLALPYTRTVGCVRGRV
jgi:hypothetical protein